MPTDAERDAAEIERQIKAIHESRADVLDLPVTPFGRNAELAARERKVQELVEAAEKFHANRPFSIRNGEDGLALVAALKALTEG